MNNDKYNNAANSLFVANETNVFIPPLRDSIGLSVEAAYAVQLINTKRWIEQGRRIVGRKIGLTSAAVQAQLGVDQPDFGALFADMEYADGSELPFEILQQPKAEAEVALILKHDLDHADVTLAELMCAIEYVVPAIEIVGSRIQDWDIKISDTIADNASSGVYVLGGAPRKLDEVDLGSVSMLLKRNGQPVSYGAGKACLGHPLNAALWLVRTCAAQKSGLKKGEVILTGALGPMVDVSAGDSFEAVLTGLGDVTFTVSEK